MNARRILVVFSIAFFFFIADRPFVRADGETEIPSITANPAHTATRVPSVTPTRELTAAELEIRENEAYVEKLLNEINLLREKYDRPALIPDPALEQVAKDQAAWFARSNRLSERTKDNRTLKTLAQEYKYAGGASFAVRQNSAMVWKTTPTDYVIDKIWFSSVGERAKLLSADYLHAGIATVVINNRRFIALVTGKLANGALTYTPLPTIDNATPVPIEDLGDWALPPAENPVITSTPASDGSIAHIVLKGQTLSEIAYAYESGWNGIALLNNLDLENPLIYEGDLILIRPRFTDTVTPTVTGTPIPPTRTPRPTYTLAPGDKSRNKNELHGGTPVPPPGGFVNSLYGRLDRFKVPIAWALIIASALGLTLAFVCRKN